MNAISCCSTSVRYAWFSVIFSNVLLSATGKDLSYQCSGFKWNLNRADCMSGGLIGQIG